MLKLALACADNSGGDLISENMNSFQNTNFSCFSSVLTCATNSTCQPCLENLARLNAAATTGNVDAAQWFAALGTPSCRQLITVSPDL